MSDDSDRDPDSAPEDRTISPPVPEHQATRSHIVDPSNPPSSDGEAAAPAAPVPEAIGEYRILSKLGEGGMGVVFEAEQQNPRRRVALKVLRGGQFVDDLRLKLFQREVDTLARLKHPNIGAIYESGCTDDGQHFFAMELVRGDLLDAYLESRRGPVGRAELEHRLHLFRKVVDAVHYAHQRGVIHRDLKPSNIVVTPEAADASETAGVEPKILDFGLARLAGPGADEQTLVTQIGTIRGTLPYMSPEQTLGTPEDVDVRTDVYALGVILYEMLAGCRPYDVEDLPLVEAVRVIREQTPASLQRVGATFRPDADLETITNKALEKDPERRYASAAALADDIGRFLTSQPIHARPPSTAYQLRKLVARHKAPFALALTVVVLLLGFGLGMSVLYARAVAAEAKALDESHTAESALAFMIDMFEMSDPSEAHGRTITVREILDRGASQIGTEFENNPEVQARLMATMGWVYRGLGLYEEAQPLLEQSLDLRREILGPDHVRTLRAMNNLAVLYENRGRIDEAERLQRDALRLQRERLGASHPETLRSMSNLAVLYLGQRRWEEAEELYSEALATQRGVLGDDDPATLRSMDNLAVMYKKQGRYDEAEPLHRAALEGRRRVLGPQHPETLGSMNNLAVLYDDQGRYDDAESLYVQTLEGQRRVLGKDHPDTLTCQYNLALIYHRLGRYEKAGDLFLDALERFRRVRGAGHPDTLDTLYNLACVSAQSGRREQAIEFLRQAVERGYTYGGDPAGMLTDPDLSSLHEDPAFEAVAIEIRKLAAES